MEVPYSIGIDIGASKANIGVVHHSGKIIASSIVPTGYGCDCRATLDMIVQSAQQCIKAAAVDCIGFVGIGVPGTVDAEMGSVLVAPNLKWENEPILSYVRSYFHCGLALTQDCRAAALGEYYFGAGKGGGDLVCITIGTGISCGIIINGNIHTGLGTAGELGHVIIEQEGKQCNCGKKGCLETYASGTALTDAAKALGLRDARELFERAANGDERARRVVRRGITALGMGIVNLVSILSPESVVISGGLCAQKDYVDGIKEFVYQNAYAVLMNNKKFKIETALLGEKAPMIGAAIYYKNNRACRDEQDLFH